MTAAAQIHALQQNSLSELLGTMLNPFAAARALGALVNVLLDALIALPRIAASLDQLTPAVHAMRELSRLRGTLERLEKLGGFLGEELPEAQHQLEAVRRQLAASGSRTESIDRQLRDTAAAVYALVDVLRTVLAGGAANRAVDVLGRVVEPRGAGERPGAQRSKPGRAS